MRRQEKVLAVVLLLLLSLGNSRGSTVAFKPAATYPVGTAPRFVATADLNADGKPDLVVVNFGFSDRR
jgi:hypothetical protein